MLLQTTSGASLHHGTSSSMLFPVIVIRTRARPNWSAAAATSARKQISTATSLVLWQSNLHNFRNEQSSGPRRALPEKSRGVIYLENLHFNSKSSSTAHTSNDKKDFKSHDKNDFTDTDAGIVPDTYKDKDRRNKTKRKAKTKKKNAGQPTWMPTCYGCGAPLQTQQVDAPGYVAPDVYALKCKYGQLRSVLCGRCRLLTHGHMLTAVGGHGGYSGGNQFISAEDLRQKLSHLRHEKALIIKLVDIVDFNGSFLSRVRELVGANPIILVATKVDLLPKGTDFNAVGDWLVEATVKKKLNVLSVHLTSAKSLSGFVGIASEIQKQRKGRDVYVLGSANVGKSAFIDALLKTMSLKNLALAAARRYKPVQSAVPGTTLGPIAIDAFLGEGKLFDTPGVHLHHRQAAVVNSDDLSYLAPQSRLKGCVVSTNVLNKENNELFYTSKKISFKDYKSSENLHSSQVLDGLSIFWGGLVRVDIVKIHPGVQLTLYGPKAVKVRVVPTCEADKFYEDQLGESLKPPSGKEKAVLWPGLMRVCPIHANTEHKNRPIHDIAISGLGWISIERAPLFNCGVAYTDNNHEQLHYLVHVPKPVEVFVRPPMPVGSFGSSWYEYSELTEKEEETRPKVYY